MAKVALRHIQESHSDFWYDDEEVITDLTLGVPIKSFEIFYKTKRGILKRVMYPKSVVESFIADGTWKVQ